MIVLSGVEESEETLYRDRIWRDLLEENKENP